jgi:antitoxin (DNA-binding transcriptional repressor) of toxin-antitoxin stability system
MSQSGLPHSDRVRITEDILGRVESRGDSFVIEHNGNAVARIVPLHEKPSASLREALAVWRAAGPPDLREPAWRSRPPAVALLTEWTCEIRSCSLHRCEADRDNAGARVGGAGAGVQRSADEVVKRGNETISSGNRLGFFRGVMLPLFGRRYCRGEDFLGRAGGPRGQRGRRVRGRGGDSARFHGSLHAAALGVYRNAQASGSPRSRSRNCAGPR